MGVVYKARHLKLDSFVALKFLLPHLVPQKAAKKRFIQEAKAASSLEHPNICAAYDCRSSSSMRHSAPKSNRH
ncbi:MAG: serine/threonine protein kinase, partial [Candidatus Binatia bacterium]